MSTETIKETKEALVGLNELVIFIAERAKDGVGADDAMALVQKLIGDEEFKAKMAAAVGDIQKVKAETADLQVEEIVELGAMQLGYLPRIVAAFKK